MFGLFFCVCMIPQYLGMCGKKKSGFGTSFLEDVSPSLTYIYQFQNAFDTTDHTDTDIDGFLSHYYLHTHDICSGNLPLPQSH